MAAARGRDLWEYLAPEGDRAAWPARPVAPVLGEYPLLAGVVPGNATLNGLTQAGRTLYLAAEQHYDALLKRHTAHRTKVNELSEWMRKTVHPSYRLTHMPADQPIERWYDNLRELGAITQRALKFQYRNEYEAFIGKSSSKKIGDLSKWTDDWLQKVTKAHNAGAEVTEAFKLVTDLERALRNTHPNWTTAFRNSHSAEIATNTLRYQTIATELRQEATILTVSRPGGSGRVVKGGAFNTFSPGSDAESEDQASQSDADASRGNRQERRARGRPDNRTRGKSQQRKPRSAVSKRPRQDTRTDTERENPNHTDCIVCFGRHPIDRCWFVFPELRKEDWSPIPQIEKLALDRMERLEEVKKAVKAAQKRRKEKRVRFNDSESTGQ
ncbi:hypothetical protein F4861DRAFT_535930 [Xylaria intraflava]|nr:hypothetical protein F4861DRAFT_535930 [Xylaria intraflava]